MTHANGDLTIRRLGATDAAKLDRLAQRDSAEVPGGTVYAAVAADGSLLAALSLETGALVADPFRPTAQAASLLRVWVDGIGRPLPTPRPAGAPSLATSPC
jgi:hypothetical protein